MKMVLTWFLHWTLQLKYSPMLGEVTCCVPEEITTQRKVNIMQKRSLSLRNASLSAQTHLNPIPIDWRTLFLKGIEEARGTLKQRRPTNDHVTCCVFLPRNFRILFTAQLHTDSVVPIELSRRQTKQTIGVIATHYRYDNKADMSVFIGSLWRFGVTNFGWSIS